MNNEVNELRKMIQVYKYIILKYYIKT